MFRGFNPGPIDGLAGTLTTRAVIQFQKQQDVEPTGAIDDKLLELLAET
jgi:peptidoglycan hydrolase-like protein with peptidoglycan-binding domain